ncbi:hypothetical protein COY07_00515 [Candidatus Peregrinibacteria bacterium CG_4_10_14_0_2_um_filter_43_11]|nr:MAG: hypothetical protein COY07_00515 [Candidatus Peregrinibacteria bacterium CG_4_10_14_0_2_um_filter_43_11]
MPIKNQTTIEQIILGLTADFRRYPDKYLTESDVKCALVNRLMRSTEYGSLQNTEYGSKSIPVHSEVRWYGASGRLKWRSDIVILDVSDLRVKDGILKLPSKGFGFNYPKAIIEIKLRRPNGESDNVFRVKIEKDISKLAEIRSEVTGNYFCALVAFDKKGSIENIETNEKVKLFYTNSKQNA